MSKINFKEVYPINVNGIAQIGVENWLKHYDPPFDPILYKERHLEIFQKFISIACTGEDEKINKFFIANFKIVLLTLETMRNFETKVNIKNKYKFILSKNLTKIEDYPLEQISDSLSLKIFAKISSSIKERLKSRLKNNYLFLKFLKGVRTNNKVSYIGTYNSDLENFIIKNEKYPQYFVPSNFSKSSKKMTLPDIAISRINKFYDEFNFLKNDQKILLKIKTEKILSNNWEIFENLLQTIQSKNQLLLANGLGSILHRLIIICWGMNGGKCIGFMHGNADYTSYSPEYIGYDGLLICDKMICKTTYQKKQLDRTIRDYGGNLKSAEIIIK